MLTDLFSAPKSELLREIARLNIQVQEMANANAKLVMEKCELESLLPFDVLLARTVRLMRPPPEAKGEAE